MQGSSDVLQFRIPPDKPDSKFLPEQLDQIAEKFGMITSYISPAQNPISSTKVSDPINLNPSQSSAILKRSLKGKQKFTASDPNHCEKHNTMRVEKDP